jgi:hypothetical protein
MLGAEVVEADSARRPGSQRQQGLASTARSVLFPGLNTPLACPTILAHAGANCSPGLPDWFRIGNAPIRNFRSILLDFASS